MRNTIGRPGCPFRGNDETEDYLSSHLCDYNTRACGLFRQSLWWGTTSPSLVAHMGADICSKCWNGSVCGRVRVVSVQLAIWNRMRNLRLPPIVALFRRPTVRASRCLAKPILGCPLLAVGRQIGGGPNADSFEYLFHGPTARVGHSPPVSVFPGHARKF